MRNIKKLFSLLLVMFLSFSGIPAMASTTASTMGNMKIHYIDVGQGDSELIQVEGKNVLLDAGNNDDKTYNYLKSLGVKKLDYVISTHPHSDHMGGMSKVINNFEIGTFYSPKVTSTTQTYMNLINDLKTKNLKITVPKVGDTLTIGNATLTFLAPNSEKYEDLNNYSIVFKLKYGNNSFLFMGDAETVSESEILAKQLDIQADVIKISHHGSYSSSSENFLNKIGGNLKYAIISVGLNNDYGHPHQSTLDKLNSRGIKTFRTDVSGTVVATSNGTNISFNTAPVASNTNSSAATKTYTTTNTLDDIISGVNITVKTAPSIDITDNGVTLNNKATVGASYNGNSISYNRDESVNVTTNTSFDEIIEKGKEKAEKALNDAKKEVSNKISKWF